MKQLIEDKTMNAELLNPRYKVIANYPDSNLEKGDILHKYSFDNGNYCYTTNLEIPLQGVCKSDNEVETYIHLFQKLEWWEERNIEELPKFVIIEDKILKVKKWIIEDKNVWLNLQYPEPSFAMGCKDYPPAFPATEQEYNKIPIT